jgi:hypothetical protein
MKNLDDKAMRRRIATVLSAMSIGCAVPDAAPIQCEPDAAPIQCEPDAAVADAALLMVRSLYGAEPGYRAVMIPVYRVDPDSRVVSIPIYDADIRGTIISIPLYGNAEPDTLTIVRPDAGKMTEPDD